MALMLAAIRFPAWEITATYKGFSETKIPLLSQLLAGMLEKRSFKLALQAPRVDQKQLHSLGGLGQCLSAH